MAENHSQLLAEWLNQIETLEPTTWERLPELDLYMDQVITLLNRQLAPVSSEDDRPLTSSMINNYVKDGVLPRPEKKKYNRDHLTLLLMICTLKSVFSLPEIAQLVNSLSAVQASETLYTSFQADEQMAVKAAADRLRDLDSMDNNARYRLALTLALEANANRVAASRLLRSLQPSDPEPDKAKEKKDKKEKKKKKATSEE